MANIHIETSQNVSIEHNIASVGERMLAQIIDYAAFFVYYMIIMLLLASLSITSTAVIIIMILPVIFYSFIMEILFNGQTIGKMVIKTRVIKLDGSQPTILSYFLRWIFRIIDISLFSGLVAIITIIVNGKGQRLGDIAAGTTVITLKTPVRLSDTIHMHLTENYQVSFPEAENLTDRDIVTIKEVIKHLAINQNKTALDMANDAKSAVETKLGINSGMDPKYFLKTIIKDYNFIHRGL